MILAKPISNLTDKMGKNLTILGTVSRCVLGSRKVKRREFKAIGGFFVSSGPRRNFAHAQRYPLAKDTWSAVLDEKHRHLLLSLTSRVDIDPIICCQAASLS
jgi:hypothetical protein